MYERILDYYKLNACQLPILGIDSEKRNLVITFIK